MSTPEQSSRDTARFGNESTNNSSRLRARGDEISNADDSEGDPSRRTKRCRTSHETYTSDVSAWPVNGDTTAFGTAASRSLDFPTGQTSAALAAAPINASSAASRTAKVNATISTSNVTREKHSSSSCIGTAHASAPSIFGLETAPSSKRSGNSFAATTSSGTHLTSGTDPATPSNSWGRITATAPSTLSIGLGNFLIKKPSDGTNSAAPGTAPTAGTSSGGWDESFARISSSRTNAAAAAAFANPSYSWGDSTATYSNSGTNAAAAADTSGSPLGNFLFAKPSTGSRGGKERSFNETKVAAAAPSTTSNCWENHCDTNQSSRTNVTATIAPATSSSTLGSSIFAKPKSGAHAATNVPPMSIKGWGGFQQPMSETNVVSAAAAAAAAAATSASWSSVKLSGSSNDLSTAVSNSSSFVFTPMSASDKELAPVQETDYEGTDSGDSKPTIVKRSGKRSQFRNSAHSSIFYSSGADAKLNDGLFAGKYPSETAEFTGPSPASSSKHTARTPCASLYPSSSNTTTAAYPGKPLPGATGTEHPEVMKSIMKDPSGPHQVVMRPPDANLMDISSPPIHLMHRDGGFQGARAMARATKRWLLVNIQRDTELSSHALNRDVWRDELVENLVWEGFVFWQQVGAADVIEEFLSFVHDGDEFLCFSIADTVVAFLYLTDGFHARRSHLHGALPSA
jgi:hypothetical protein